MNRAIKAPVINRIHELVGGKLLYENKNTRIISASQEEISPTEVLIQTYLTLMTDRRSSGQEQNSRPLE
jgi:hypothetical protein